MLTALRSLAFGLLALLTISATTVFANEPPQTYKLIFGGSYSPSLGAEFRVETFNLPAFGQFTGVRLVSVPSFDSPLRNLGLQPGDVITRLDGVRTDNLNELENHYSWTQVRYIKTGSQTVRIANILINGGVQPIVNPVVDNAP